MLLPGRTALGGRGRLSHFQQGNGCASTPDTAPGYSAPPVAAHTVLVVDDDASIRLLCRVNLELGGFRVVEARTLGEASTALDEEQPSVVLLDVHVGAGNGVAFVPEVRDRRPDARIAMLTGTANVEELREAGADALVPKPFDPEELVATVTRLAAEARV
jgi:DNA-binding response OmpR family regulator